MPKKSKKREGLSREQLKELALDHMSGHVVFMRNVPKDLVLSVFLPLAFAGRDVLDTFEKYGVVEVFGVLGKHKDCGRSINGFPTFVECGSLTAAEVDIFNEYVEKLRAVK